MKKPMIAVLAALIMTACVGVSMLAIGGAAMFNRNGIPYSSAPSQASGSDPNSSPQPGKVDQMQALISQYQDHEKQYQQREQQLQQQLADANAQLQQDQQTMQQFQLLLSALQQRGMIQITNDGHVLINQ